MSSYLHRIRQCVGHKKILLSFASACIRDDTGRLLWQRRADFGWWGLPGGILEPGESLPECIVREVREETGLEVKPKRLIGLYSSPDFDVTYPNGDQVQQVTACFECRIGGGNMKIDNEETLDLTWLPIDNPPSTAPWYMAMANDLILNKKAAAFDRGSLGRQKHRETFFNHIRKRVSHKSLLMPAVAAFIMNNHGDIGLQQSSRMGKWKLPWFWMELGERIDQTLINGIRQASSLNVKAIKLIGIYTKHHLKMCFDDIEDVETVTVLFKCRIIEEKQQENGSKLPGICFFPSNALPSLSECHFHFLQDGLRGQEEAIF
jgi:ADP-ribose pyrophosphatase YjhB (NUDIX family)